MAKRITLIIFILILCFGGLFGYKLFRNYQRDQSLAAFVPPAISVSTVKATAETWQPYLSSVGTLIAVSGVDITPQLSGVVTKVAFQSGQVVKTGDLLVTLDTSVLQAQLDSTLADQTLKKLTFKRNTTLAKTKSVADYLLDKSRIELQQADAAVKQLRAQIALMELKAPFSGRLGLVQINLGEFLKAGTVVTNLQTVDPIDVNFSIPSQQIGQLSVGQPIRLTVDTVSKKVFTGKIIALDARVDQTTRGLDVRGQVANTKRELYPGLFANIQVLLPQKKQVVTVPQTAVTYTLYGDSVFIVTQQKDKKGKTQLIAKRQYVTVGNRINGRVIILKGLKAGTVVVTSGQLKLQEGSSVTINNAVKL